MAAGPAGWLGWEKLGKARRTRFVQGLNRPCPPGAQLASTQEYWALFHMLAQAHAEYDKISLLKELSCNF